MLNFTLGEHPFKKEKRPSKIILLEPSSGLLGMEETVGFFKKNELTTSDFLTL